MRSKHGITPRIANDALDDVNRTAVSTWRATTVTHQEGRRVKKAIDDLLEAESKTVEDAEGGSDPNVPLPAHVRVSRGHPRAKNLQVRFRDDEYDALAAYAKERGLPVSTVVRVLVLQAIAPADDLQSAFDQLELDIAAVRRKALGA